MRIHELKKSEVISEDYDEDDVSLIMSPHDGKYISSGLIKRDVYITTQNFKNAQNLLRNSDDAYMKYWEALDNAKEIRNSELKELYRVFKALTIAKLTQYAKEDEELVRELARTT